jgi:hypothetical protein
MAIVFHRELAIPLWAVAVTAVAISPPRVMHSLTGFLAIIAIAFTIPACVRWLRPARPLVRVLPPVDQDPAPTGIRLTAGTRTRTLDEAIGARALASDAADLIRMDDDGGWQSAPSPALTEGLRSQNQRLP